MYLKVLIIIQSTKWEKWKLLSKSLNTGTSWWRNLFVAQFPATGDVTVELGATYLAFKVKIKVDRVTAVLAENVFKQRTSFEFKNLLWPFGVASTKETNQKSETEVEVSVLG